MNFGSKRFVARIEQIPTDGDMMISFSGAAEHIELIFLSAGKTQEIDIIQKGFKTPSTGFNIKNDYERELYAEIDALLFPAIDKIVPRVQDLQLDFGDFSLCYNGNRFEDFAPVTLSFDIAEFAFTDRQANNRLIEIRAGQLPPPPFAIASHNLTLLTFHSKEGRRLYPDFFQLVTGLPS